MEAKFKFSDDYFAISQDKIHILRNGLESECFNFDKLESLEIKKGKAIKNWVVLFCLGLSCVMGSLWFSKNIYSFFVSGTGRIYIEELVVPFFLMMFGIFAIYKSVKKETILKLMVNEKTYKFSLEKLMQDGEYDELVEYLKSKNNRLTVE